MLLNRTSSKLNYLVPLKNNSFIQKVITKNSMVARHYSIMPHHDFQQIVKALQMPVEPQELIHLLENEQKNVEDMEHLYKKNNDIIHNYKKKYYMTQTYLPF